MKRMLGYLRDGKRVCHYCGRPSEESPCDRPDCGGDVELAYPETGVKRLQIELLQVLDKLGGTATASQVSEATVSVGRAGTTVATRSQRDIRQSLRSLARWGWVDWRPDVGQKRPGRAKLTLLGRRIAGLNGQPTGEEG